ncbi:MAG: aldo/keto reductase [Thomasclavelia sp.]|nr:aldo/keto reductase [Thomasclavelia sp.]
MLSDSKLGFGLMRLPKDEEGNIIIDKVQTMVDAFMKKGFTYFDTAYAYAGSEAAIKQTLVDKYPRESFTLADKLPAWKINKQEDVERIFNESLSLCGVDYFDFYLLHSIEESHYPTYQKYGCFEFVKKMKEEGKIKHIGFSFHDDSKLLDEVLTAHPEIEFVQLQLNYLDWNNEVVQSRKNYEVARKHNVPIVVMEPVKGGTLASFTKEIESELTDYNPRASIASWALRYIASLDGVMTVLSGMSTQEQLEDNLQTMSEFKKMNEDEYKIIDKITHMILNQPTIPCTKCRYCVPGCPMKVEIPELFTAYNSQMLYGKSSRYKHYYTKHSTAPQNPASACIECGQCEGVCPQHLEIINLLKKVSKLFDEE